MLKRMVLMSYPFLLPVWAIYSLPRIKRLPDHYLSLLPLFPYLAIAVGALLAWRFNRSRIFFSLLLILGLYVGLNWHAQVAGAGGHWLILAISLLLPLNLLLLSFFKERGIFTVHGGVRFAFLAGQVGVVWWLINRDDMTWLSWLEQSWLSVSWLDGLRAGGGMAVAAPVAAAMSGGEQCLGDTDDGDGSDCPEDGWQWDSGAVWHGCAVAGDLAGAGVIRHGVSG